MQNKPLPSALLGALASLSLIFFDVFQPTLPAIASYFNTNHKTTQLALSLYLFGLGISQLIWGPIVDIFGRIKPFIISIFFLLVATIYCIIATTIEQFLLARILQSIFVCCSSVIALSSTRDNEEELARARQMSLIAMCISLSPIFAPVIGAFLYGHFGWRATFVFMIFIIIIIGTLGCFKIKESPYYDANQSFNFNHLKHNYRQIVASKHFWFSSLMLTLCFSAIMIFIINASYILIIKLKLPPMLFALCFAINGSFIITGNYLGIYLRKHYSIPFNIRLGSLLITAAGFFISLHMLAFGLSIISLIPVVIVVIGATLVLPCTGAIALSEFKSNTATASSLLNALRTSGSAIIASIVGALLNQYILAFGISIFVCGLSIYILQLGLIKE
jgi:Bcr/CflA subfamily drug resistance transporter